MKIDYNLDREKSIEDQLDTFAVAVNRWNPNPEDYVYKYSDLDEWQKAVIRGMAISADEIDNLWDGMMPSIDEPVPITQVKEFYQREILEEAQERMVLRMCELLVVFGDENALSEDKNDES